MNLLLSNHVSSLIGLAASACLLLASAGPSRAAVPAGDRIPTADGDLVVSPINHATFVLQYKNLTLYVDPVGGGDRFDGFPRPDLVLITHSHGDHLHPATLTAVATEKTVLIVSAGVVEQLPGPLQARAHVLTNGQSRTELGVKVEAVPAYNLTPDKLRYHPKGRDNGYVLTLGGRRVYVSGDTEDTPELRQLREIDVAFLCMNQPFTLTVEKAAEAVRAFKPKIVYPYHSRGSDLDKFKQLVGTDQGVEVRLRKWY